MSERVIGVDHSYDGGMIVMEAGGKFYWGTDDYLTPWTQEIPKYLYDALNKFEDERKREEE